MKSNRSQAGGAAESKPRPSDGDKRLSEFCERASRAAVPRFSRQGAPLTRCFHRDDWPSVEQCQHLAQSGIKDILDDLIESPDGGGANNSQLYKQNKAQIGKQDEVRKSQDVQP